MGRHKDLEVRKATNKRHIKCFRKGRSLLELGFRPFGIWPFNPHKHDVKTFAASDALLGIKPGPDAQTEVKAARERGRVMAPEIVRQATVSWKPEAREALVKIADNAAQARRAKYKGPGVFDPVTGIARMFYTSESFVMATAAAEAQKAAAEMDKAARRVERAAKSASISAKKAEAAAAKSEKAAAKAAAKGRIRATTAMQQETLAGAAAPSAAPKVGSKRRAADLPSPFPTDANPYGRSFQKRVRASSK